MGLSDLETIPETGAVFTIGRSRFADNIASHFFIRRDPVVFITCGDEHSAVICQTGRLFVFGSNDWGQLGLGHKNHISKPSCVKILKPQKVTHVACGRAHTLICTGAQKLFTCGSDQEGQLGRGTSAIGDYASSPVLVYDSGLAGAKIVQVAAGSYHSLALTDDGVVLAWGSNLEGQLGLPDISGLVNKPTKVHITEPVKQISAGYYHSAFLTESGLVYVCGESESGKLGIDAKFSSQAAPKQMQLPCPAMHVACGGHHTLILAENGNLYCTGNNSSGQLGLGINVTELFTPKLLPRGALQNETITRIACGESHTAIVTESGKLFTCGDGRHGKLGLEENENNVHELTFAPRYKEVFVTNVACGGCHTILVAQRRESNNLTQREMEATQTDHIQKRSSLPPLKLPVSRMQSEVHDEKIDETEKEQSNQEEITEETSTTSATIETPLESVREDTEDNRESIMNGVPDSMNNIEKIDSPKKSPEASPAKTPLEVTSNMSNQMEVKSKDIPEESKESNAQNGNAEIENDNETRETEVDAENNVEETKKSETTNSEENNNKNDNETNEEAKKSNKENVQLENEENNTTDVKDNENDRSKSMDKMESPKNIKEETSPEKQASIPDSTPPPKPPRLKSGNGNDSSAERSSSIEQEDENIVVNATEVETVAEKPEITNVIESTQKRESSSRKSSTKTGSSRSSRSRVNTEETIEIDKQNDKEKIIEEEKMMNDNVQDDADVVQSPAPRTGKMSKMFKSRRQQTVENGTKTTGTVNHKSKSKTCNIL
ncbi:X-linked retinitis pigmentosa GTPase regulator-like [Colletes gigas]|uniref:X-linked retinitis pigmentosa GTPase regulator-like n=1 Tax=Colletes gigas TaxID=935657 RepID=UPI001C9B10D5|nr:X-linked retinitis pigmentosa GTPase regulator-like [Colletes gigas]